MVGKEKDRGPLHTDENGNCKKCGEPLQYRSWERHCNYNKTHTERFPEDITFYPCDFCDKVFHRIDQYNTHLKKRDTDCQLDKKSVWQRVGGGPPEPPQIDHDGNCEKCGGAVPRRNWRRHLSSKEHLAVCPDDRVIAICPCCQREFTRSDHFNDHIYKDDRFPECRQQRPVKAAAGKTVGDKDAANAPQAGSSKHHLTKGKAPTEATGEQGRAGTQSRTQQQQHLRGRKAKSPAASTRSSASPPDAQAFALLHKLQGRVHVDSTTAEDLGVLFGQQDISSEGGQDSARSHHRDSSRASHRESSGSRHRESSDDSLPTAKDEAFLVHRQQTLSKGVPTALSRPHSQSRGKKS